MGLPARYRVVESTRKSVLIRDLGPWDRHFTVTNDAENVVKGLVEAGMLEGRRLYWFDSAGELGELKVENGRFAGFAPASEVP